MLLKRLYLLALIRLELLLIELELLLGVFVVFVELDFNFSESWHHPCLWVFFLEKYFCPAGFLFLTADAHSRRHLLLLGLLDVTWQAYWRVILQSFLLDHFSHLDSKSYLNWRMSACESRGAPLELCSRLRCALLRRYRGLFWSSVLTTANSIILLIFVGLRVLGWIKYDRPRTCGIGTGHAATVPVAARWLQYLPLTVTLNDGTDWLDTATFLMLLVPRLDIELLLRCVVAVFILAAAKLAK